MQGWCDQCHIGFCILCHHQSGYCKECPRNEMHTYPYPAPVPNGYCSSASDSDLSNHYGFTLSEHLEYQGMCTPENISETHVQASTYVHLTGVEIPKELPLHFPSTPNLVGNESELSPIEKPLPRSLSGP